jgi:hypothetical protein
VRLHLWCFVRGFGRSRLRFHAATEQHSRLDATAEVNVSCHLPEPTCYQQVLGRSNVALGRTTVVQGMLNNNVCSANDAVLLGLCRCSSVSRCYTARATWSATCAQAMTRGPWLSQASRDTRCAASASKCTQHSTQSCLQHTQCTVTQCTSVAAQHTQHTTRLRALCSSCLGTAHDMHPLQLQR